MNDAFFFEIPIYRCTFEKHSEDMEKKYQEFASKCYMIDKKDIDYFFSQLNICYPWKYNEIIGYLNLYILGNQLRIDYWKVNKKRYNKGITLKKYKFVGKALEAVIPEKLNSIEIMNFINTELLNLSNAEFKKYHFDLETFTNISNFVNWKELIIKLNRMTTSELKI